jgi:hypothetical protein
MNGEYWPVRQISSAMTASPATPPTSTSTRTARADGAGRRLGQAMASAAPISSPSARVSVPS